MIENGMVKTENEIGQCNDYGGATVSCFLWTGTCVSYSGLCCFFDGFAGGFDYLSAGEKTIFGDCGLYIFSFVSHLCLSAKTLGCAVYWRLIGIFYHDAFKPFGFEV